jgi:putative transposase
MVKNRHLARAIADVGMGEFRRQVEYKARWYRRKAVIVNRWAPTSKTCSGCGHRMVKMPLNVRAWTCPSCGAVHDRDVNAAKNILRLAIEPKQPVGNGLLRVEGTLNLPANVVGSPGEARTVAEKLNHADRPDRAA